MKIVYETHFKVVTPSEGMWLYNEKEGIITDSLDMPFSADETQWSEITNTEKQRIESMELED